MSSFLKRWLAVGTAAAVALVSFAPAVPATAAPRHTTVAASAKTTALKKATNWLVANPATDDDGYAGQIASATGLAIAGGSASAKVLRERVAALADDAATESAANIGTAMKLAILLEIVRQNPTTFGGTNVIATIRTGIAADGQVGSFGSAYAQALAIIALKRAKQPVPAAVVTKLLSFQSTTSTDPALYGAFGYEWPAGTFNADPDSTALAIQALDLIGHHKSAVRKAATWAKKNQTKAGYWAAYSPVNSTALMATALKQIGRSYGKARSWLLTQQVADGGFPAELGGSDSNLLATSDAVSLLVGKSMAKVKYALRGYSKSPRPKITGTVRVGQVLTVNTRTWSPQPSFAYQWYRSGKKIAGATASTYTLTAADKGKKIRVRVKAYGIGLKTHYEYSRHTARVKQALVG